MKSIHECQLFFLGAGSISEAMMKGLLAAHLLPAQQITISNRKNTARLQELQQHYGVHISQNSATDIAQADLVILAMKPFDLATALHEVKPYLSPRQLIVSLAAGITTTAIERCLDGPVPVIRSMPNTSSFVQASATAICAGQYATPQQLAVAQQLFSAIGISVRVNENQIDAVTGLSGSGPAYFYYVVEALLEAGLQCGLPADTCRQLLLQTLYGAAKMLQETGKDPAELRRQVTSPNGTTMAGIAVLDRGDVQQILQQAVQRATQRATEMGQELQISAS